MVFVDMIPGWVLFSSRKADATDSPFSLNFWWNDATWDGRWAGKRKKKQECILYNSNLQVNQYFWLYESRSQEAISAALSYVLYTNKDKRQSSWFVFLVPVTLRARDVQIPDQTKC